MLGHTEYRTLYGTLRDYIEKLCAGSVFHADPAVRSSISEAVREEADLLLFLAESVHRVGEARSLLERFRSIFTLGESEQLTAETDHTSKSYAVLRDEINYLRVCVKNICGVDLDTAGEEELRGPEAVGVRVHNPDHTAHIDGTRYENIPNSLAAFRHALNEEIASATSKEIDEFILKSHAYERLNRDISDGSIYIYTSKPKLNVMIKWFLMMLSILGIFVCIGLLASLVRRIRPDEKGGGLITLALTIVPLFSLAYFAYSAKNIHGTFKNDNFKYSFGKKELMSNSIFISLIWCLFVTFIPLKESHLHEPEIDPTVRLLIFSILSISLVMGAVNLLSFFTCQPKKNTRLIEDVLARHMSDISKGNSI